MSLVDRPVRLFADITALSPTPDRQSGSAVDLGLRIETVREREREGVTEEGSIRVIPSTARKGETSAPLVRAERKRIHRKGLVLHGKDKRIIRTLTRVIHLFFVAICVLVGAQHKPPPKHQIRQNTGFALPTTTAIHTAFVVCEVESYSDRVCFVDCNLVV